MKKIVFMLCMSLAVTMCASPCKAKQEKVTYKYKASNKTLTISGKYLKGKLPEGMMGAYDETIRYDYKWSSLSGKVKKVVLKKGVERIGHNAFGNFTKLKSVYKQRTGNTFEDTDYESFGLIDEKENLTNAGALLADESPVRHSRLFCTRWNGLNKSGGAVDALDDAEYSGSVISLIENGEAFIKRNCKMKWRKTANSREEMPEYVERSYHEALVNALAHRDYLVNGSEVHIDIYDDRMEIYSPGGMPDGSMIQDRDPLMVPSTRRNPVLADVFNRLGYMERKGSGFGKIISGYEFQINYDESKRPSFRSDRYQFTVVMPNLNYDVSHDFEENETMSESMSESMSKLERTRMQIILHYLDTNKEINSSIAAKLLKVEIKTASRLLLKAEKLDILNSYGKTKNKVYFRE